MTNIHRKTENDLDDIEYVKQSLSKQIKFISSVIFNFVMLKHFKAPSYAPWTEC